MIEMLLKSLGITPEIAKGHIDEFKKMAQGYDQRIAAIESNVAKIAAALNVPLQEENENG